MDHLTNKISPDNNNMPIATSTRRKGPGPKIDLVPRTDKIAKSWDRILATIWKNTTIPNISMIGCFKYGPNLQTTIVILLNVKALPRETVNQNGEAIRRLLDRNGLKSVQISIEKGAITSGSSSSTGDLNYEVLDSPALMGQSMAHKSNIKATGTLGAFFQVKPKGSSGWKTVAMTCHHVVAEPKYAQDMLDYWAKNSIVPRGMDSAKDMLRKWHEGGIGPNDRNRSMVAVDHPGKISITQATELVEGKLRELEKAGVYDLLAQDAKGEGEFMARNQKQILQKGKVLVQKSEALRRFAAANRIDFGIVWATSGIRKKPCTRGFTMGGDNTPGAATLPMLVALDWALVEPRTQRIPRIMVSKQSISKLISLQQ